MSARSPINSEKRESFPRRRLLALGAGALLGIAFTSNSEAQAPSLKAPASGKAPRKKAAARGPNQSLVDAAKRCGRVGDICLKHCIRLTRAGDTSLADCMLAVQAMLPVCSTMGQLAGQDAKRLKNMARLCADVCADCEDECRKHEFHHRECKNCAEACAAMIKECKAVIGA